MSSNESSLAFSSHPQARHYAVKLIFAFAFGWAILSAAMNVMNPLLPLVRTEFDLSGAETGLLTWSFTLPYLIMQIPAGVLADRIGPKLVLVSMTLVAALGMIAIGLWSFSLIAFIGFAVIHRLGAGVYYPTAFGVASRSVPTHQRGKASSLLVVGMALGSAVGLSLSVPLYEIGGKNWRFPLLVSGLLILLLPLLFQRLMRRSYYRQAAVTAKVSSVIRDRSLLALFAINFCSNYAFNNVMVWGPSFMGSERGLSLALAGFYVALVNLIGFPGGLTMGFLSDKVGRRRLTILLFLAAAASLFVLAKFDQPEVVLVAIIGFGVAGKWTSDGVLAAWMGDHANSKFASSSNAIYGINNTARMFGGLLSPLVAGVLLDQTGTLSTGFFVAGALLLAAAALAPIVAERSERQIA